MRTGLGPVALALGVWLGAATGQAQARVWDAPGVVARAVSRAPAVQSAWGQLELARASAVFGRVPLVGNPAVGVRAMVGVPDREAATYTVYLGIPIEVSGLRAHYRREASWAEREAQAAYDAARNEARAEALQLYTDVAVADAAVVTTAERAATARELLSRTEARRRAQAATDLDVSLAQREQGQADADLAAARRERELAAGRLRASLDLLPSDPVAVAPIALPETPAGLDRDGAVARALAHRREPASLAAGAARARASTHRLRAQAVAPLVLALEGEQQSYRYNTFGASLQWSLPLIHTQQGERAVATAEAAMLDTRRGLAERQVAREAASAFDALVAQLAELRALREQALPAAERNLALTVTLYESGTVDAFRVLLARQDLANVRIRFLTAMREAWRARIALDRAMGEP